MNERANARVSEWRVVRPKTDVAYNFLSFPPALPSFCEASKKLVNTSPAAPVTTPAHKGHLFLVVFNLLNLPTNLPLPNYLCWAEDTTPSPIEPVPGLPLPNYLYSSHKLNGLYYITGPKPFLS